MWHSPSVVPPTRLRRFILALALVAAASPAAAGAGVDPRGTVGADDGDLLAYHIADPTLERAPRISTGSWGGEYPTASGAVVRIRVSNTYAVDEAESQQWAEYLDTLVHGPELSRLEVYFAPFREMQAICGRTAAACYSPIESRIVVPGEDVEGGPTVQSLLAHEYGHHVAANRLNPPWRAVTHGTKRWSTHLAVCPRSTRGELAPGAGGMDYQINPGEIFAESYRVLNERRLGTAESPWNVVSELFYPDDVALRLLEQDVVRPWTGPTTVTLRGKGTRNVRVATPLDGPVTVRLTAPRGTSYRVSAPGTVCGQRSVTVRLTRVKGRGGYTLRVTRP